MIIFMEIDRGNRLVQVTDLYFNVPFLVCDRSEVSSVDSRRISRSPDLQADFWELEPRSAIRKKGRCYHARL